MRGADSAVMTGFDRLSYQSRWLQVAPERKFLLWLLLMALPLLAVGCRRMHDIGRSGIWFVLGVIIPWFAVISLALCCLRSA